MRQKQLLINGKAVHDRLYAIHRDPRVGDEQNAFNYQLYRRDNFGPETVPAGHFFCMGDNRDQSYDSRFWGMLPRHLIKGRALFIYWSNGGETSDGQWRGMGDQLRQIGKSFDQPRNASARRLALNRHRDRVAVVLDQEQHRQAPQARHVERFPEFPFAGRTLARGHEGDFVTRFAKQP